MSEPTTPIERGREALPFVRLAMIVSSLAPLFLLWAVRGIHPISDWWLIPACTVLIVVPNAILITRVLIARKRHSKVTILVRSAEDNREHLLVYLFAMLIPLFDANIGNPRDSIATVITLLFVVFLFWHMNLHYMNVLFAVFGYRVFTIKDNETTGLLILLSKRVSLRENLKLQAYRMSNTVFIETGEP